MLISLILYLTGLVIIWCRFLLHYSTFNYFVLFYFFFFLLKPPRKAISPLTILYLYYGVWFIAAPIFATRYTGMILQPEYSLAFALVFSVFGLGVIAISMGGSAHIAENRSEKLVHYEKTPKKRTIFLLYIISTLMVYCIIMASGGFSRWIADPGDAFLNRSGSGPYVILSHFSAMLLSSLSGFYSFKKSKKWPLVFFIVWLLITSPIHGSKLQISIFLLLLLLPWIRNLKFFSLQTIALFFSFGIIFLLGLYYRNTYFSDFGTVIRYAFNYFNTLELLTISIRDMQPDLLTTFFLPFNKFLTPFGLKDPKLYYDMNHYLTDLYFPNAWKIRATEQWPVETDIYLNFLFIGGLWLVGVYLFLVSFIFNRAERRQTLGNWVTAILLCVFMISHLRGSLYNHTDFYMYPMIIIIYKLLRKYQFS